MYENTIEVFLPNVDKYEDLYIALMEDLGRLNMYGFKNEIRFGLNTGVIDIHNYEKAKGKQLLGYLKNQMGKDLKAGEQIREGNRHIVRLLLGKPEACIWLDRLLMDKQMKTFQIPGAEKNQKAKMKIYLICGSPEEDID